MQMKLLIAMVILCGLFSATPCLAQDKQCPDAQADVRSFGEVSHQPPGLAVPKDLERFVPPGFTARCIADVNTTGKGETLLLLDDGENIFPRVELRVIQNEEDHLLFGQTISGVAGLRIFQLADGKELVGFAYHSGGDQSDTEFEVFEASDDSYHSVFRKKTTEGQFKVLDDRPLRFELWSANTSLDPLESCVWCPHRYRIQTYAWLANSFMLIAERTTVKAMLPGNIAEIPWTSVVK